MTLLAVPAAAQGAEVVTTAPDQIAVSQGQTTSFEVEVSAEGIIGCGAHPTAPARAVLDGVYSLVGSEPAVGSSPAPATDFFANGSLVLLPPLGCGVTWHNAPATYRRTVTIAAAPDVPLGTHTVALRSRTTNPLGALFAPLADATPEEIQVSVVPPEQENLSNPVENQSINLLPVRGLVRVRYPGTETSVQIEDPVQVPPDTGVNTAQGFVTLLSDSTGNGTSQSATLWNGVFKVDYTRLLNPGTGDPPKRSANPITELALNSPPACGKKAGKARASARAARKKGRGLWARGKGRFRTKGRYGAGTVRGTQWFTQETCDGTLWDVTNGVVRVLDFTIHQAFNVGKGGSYLAQPPNTRRGTSRD